ncbi:MAG TPA: threo-3-hydroxy-L-aspartate ammonia-lyase [Gaiellaceae bacterium]|nr:threo-3-hydroxy-L-aspartate ammonia-lyase [Gaiellaceae bacterium]
MIARSDVEAAAARLDGVAHRTPVFTSRTLDALAGGTLFLKAESLQRSGAFKFRGAYNAIASLSEEERRRGVAAYSSGNHAQAVALAASLVGAPAVILMPEDAPETKVAATRGYGAEIVHYDRFREQREALGRALAAERGLTLIPPYDHPAVVAGQGTVALELLEQAPRLDLLVTPVGGGGLISGCAVAAEGVEVVGVEPEAGDDVRRSLERLERVTIPVPRTIADGLQTTSPGELPFAIIRERVARVVTVTDEELVGAMRFLFERLKLVVEPSGAAAAAALLAGAIDAHGRRVGVVLSGGNVGADRFCDLLSGSPR